MLAIILALTLIDPPHCDVFGSGTHWQWTIMAPIDGRALYSSVPTRVTAPGVDVRIDPRTPYWLPTGISDLVPLVLDMSAASSMTLYECDAGVKPSALYFPLVR